MSYRVSRNFDLKALKHPDDVLDFSAIDSLSEEELKAMFHDILQKGVHGFCYSSYEEGQRPGDRISKSQVQKRMQILQPHCKWVRSFSCIEGNEYVPVVAKNLGMNTLVGAWLSDDLEKNEEEITTLIDLAKLGFADIAAVGNEVLYRNDLSFDQLLVYIRRVKEALPIVPVGYVDAYYEFTVHPELVDICDVILTNCYPFWEGTPFEHSIVHMNQMYDQTVSAGNGKKVLVTETGWPSRGQSLKAAMPSSLNALKYFIYTHVWAQSRNIETFYFSSFDESWKTGPEGDVGSHWGVWDINETLKFGISNQNSRVCM